MTKKELELLAQAAAISATREYFSTEDLKALKRAIKKAKGKAK